MNTRNYVPLIIILAASLGVLVGIAKANPKAPVSVEYSIPTTPAAYPTPILKEDSSAGVNVLVFDSRLLTESEMLAGWNKANPAQQYRLASAEERADYWNSQGMHEDATAAASDVIDGKGRPNGTSTMNVWVVRITPA